MNKVLTGVVLLFGLCHAVAGGEVASPKAPPAGNFKSLNELVDLPHFLPGLGMLYVDPATLPIGPFLGYDRNGTLVNAIYVIPEKDMAKYDSAADLAQRLPGVRIDHVDKEYNPGHSGAPEAHYHIVHWLISHEEHMIYIR